MFTGAGVSSGHAEVEPRGDDDDDDEFSLRRFTYALAEAVARGAALVDGTSEETSSDGSEQSSWKKTMSRRMNPLRFLTR